MAYRDPNRLDRNPWQTLDGSQRRRHLQRKRLVVVSFFLLLAFLILLAVNEDNRARPARPTAQSIELIPTQEVSRDLSQSLTLSAAQLVSSPTPIVQPSETATPIPPTATPSPLPTDTPTAVPSAVPTGTPTATTEPTVILEAHPHSEITSTPNVFSTQPQPIEPPSVLEAQPAPETAVSINIAAIFASLNPSQLIGLTLLGLALIVLLGALITLRPRRR